MNYLISYNSTYNGILDNRIKREKIIPYGIFPNTKYRSGKWYYNSNENMIFKVITPSYSNTGELESIYIKSDDGYYSLICTPLNFYTDYILVKDSGSLYEDCIINNNKSYSGAEIIYWFYMNDITFEDNKYNGFWKYIDRYSMYKINDYGKYFLYMNTDKLGDHCSIVKDNSITDRHRKVIKRDYKVVNDKFMKDMVKRDKKRENEKIKAHKKKINNSQ